MNLREKSIQEAQARKAAWAGWLGSALQFYDFFLFGTATVLYLGPLFFPNSEPKLAEFTALLLVGAGFLARPFGAILLGYLADVYGRRQVLSLTSLLMGTCTFTIGLLPTFQDVGMFAPVALICLRLLQGISISGEHASASALALELSAENRRGLFASFVLSGTQIGFVFACSVFLLLPEFMEEQDIRTWGWRIPFLLSLALVVVGIWVRFKIPESPVFELEKSQRKGRLSPHKILWSDFKRELVRVVLACQISVVSTIFGIFSLSWAVRYTSMTQANMLWILIVNALVGMLVIPLWAYLSDCIGRRRVFISAALGCGILIWPYFFALSQSNVTLAFIIGVLLSGVVYGAINGVWPSLYGEMFPTKVRASGVALGTQVGFMLAAQAPALAAFITRNDPANWMMVAFLTSLSCVVSASAVYFAPETHGLAMGELGNKPTSNN